MLRFEANLLVIKKLYHLMFEIISKTFMKD